MKGKGKIILLLLSLTITIGFMNSTYSRYVAGTTGNVEADFAKWQLLVNNNDITDNNTNSISFTPVIEQSEHVRDNVIAPSSKGYFDIEIDPTNVDVSFKYKLSLQIENEEVPDLLMSKYAVLPFDYEEEDPLTFINIMDNEIENSLYMNNTIENFKYDKFTIRIYFEWFDNEETDHTEIGYLAATEGYELDISADITFEQIFN